MQTHSDKHTHGSH